MYKAKLTKLIIKYCLFVIILSGCKTINTQKNMNDKDNEIFWLSKSMFSGSFYGHPQLNIIDYKPFKYNEEAKTVDNFTIRLKKEEEIIPVGTMVKIEQIEYPTFLSKLKRPIYSAKDNIWVYLRVGKNRGKTNIFREKAHVILVPQQITNEDAVKRYLTNFLSKEDPNPWILVQREYIQNAIWEKKPVIGMSKKHLEIALGIPLKVEPTSKSSAMIGDEIWHFHEYFIVLEDEKVVKIAKIKQ